MRFGLLITGPHTSESLRELADRAEDRGFRHPSRRRPPATADLRRRRPRLPRGDFAVAVGHSGAQQRTSSSRDSREGDGNARPSVRRPLGGRYRARLECGRVRRRRHGLPAPERTDRSPGGEHQDDPCVVVRCSRPRHRSFPLDGLVGDPTPIQKPGPPLLLPLGVGDSLVLAAAEADLVEIGGNGVAEETIVRRLDTFSTVRSTGFLGAPTYKCQPWCRCGRRRTVRSSSQKHAGSVQRWAT